MKRIVWLEFKGGEITRVGDAWSDKPTGKCNRKIERIVPKLNHKRAVVGFVIIFTACGDEDPMRRPVPLGAVKSWLEFG